MVPNLVDRLNIAQNPLDPLTLTVNHQGGSLRTYICGSTMQSCESVHKIWERIRLKFQCFLLQFHYRQNVSILLGECDTL